MQDKKRKKKKKRKIRQNRRRSTVTLRHDNSDSLLEQAVRDHPDTWIHLQKQVSKLKY